MPWCAPAPACLRHSAPCTKGILPTVTAMIFVGAERAAAPNGTRRIAMSIPNEVLQRFDKEALLAIAQSRANSIDELSAEVARLQTQRDGLLAACRKMASLINELPADFDIDDVYTAVAKAEGHHDDSDH